MSAEKINFLFDTTLLVNMQLKKEEQGLGGCPPQTISLNLSHTQTNSTLGPGVFGISKGDLSEY